jgi:predicted negative regulator of RcsB-dependent stress response
MTSIHALLDAANAAAQRGQRAEAERLWRAVLESEPTHPAANQALASQAFRNGDLAGARQHLESATRGRPDDPTIALSLAVVCRQLDDGQAELAAIDAALEAQPYFLPALLVRGDCLARMGRTRASATAYMNALSAAPPEAAWPAQLRSQLVHAKAVADAHGREFASFLTDRLRDVVGGLRGESAGRWQEAVSLLSGRSRPYLSHGNRLSIPRLPAIPFYDRGRFDWVEQLESKTSAITDELRGLLAEQEASFQPYVAYEAGTPLNQWSELNNSQRWSSYFLWRDGAPVEDAQVRCPVTTSALAAVGMADIDGLCPNAMFSALAPHTHIPPHHGETNARLVVHLPLIVPDRCTYRVGFERREWRVGEVLVFDDTIEHEARNDSDELRVVLIFDVWNPLLAPEERVAMRALSAAAREFHAAE